MCDDVDRIMKFVSIVKKVEEATKQKLTRYDYEVIYKAERLCCDFTLFGQRFNDFSKIGE